LGQEYVTAAMRSTLGFAASASILDSIIGWSQWSVQVNVPGISDFTIEKESDSISTSMSVSVHRRYLSADDLRYGAEGARIAMLYSSPCWRTYQCRKSLVRVT